VRVLDLSTPAPSELSFGRAAPLMHRHGVSVLPRLPRVMALAFQPGLLIHRETYPGSPSRASWRGLPESP